MMHVIFDHSRQETENIHTFFFRPEKPLSYTPGQFIELTLQHDNPDDRGVRRWFTLSSSPHEELASITTRLSADGSTFKKALSAMQPGDSLTMNDPMGDFVLPRQTDVPLVFVAGGIGITPLRSMLAWLASCHEKRPITCLYAVRSEEDILFQETFHAANQHVTIIVSDPSPAWGGERGHLTAEMIVGLSKPADDTLLYLSGPEEMMQHIRQDLLKSGLHSNQLVTDYFPGYAA